MLFKIEFYIQTIMKYILKYSKLIIMNIEDCKKWKVKGKYSEISVSLLRK